MYETEKRLLGPLCLVLKKYNQENDADIFRDYFECWNIMKSLVCIENWNINIYLLKINSQTPHLCV